MAVLNKKAAPEPEGGGADATIAETADAAGGPTSAPAAWTGVGGAGGAKRLWDEARRGWEARVHPTPLPSYPPTTLRASAHTVPQIGRAHV